MFPVRQGVARATSGRNFSDFNKLYGPFVNGNFEFPEHLKTNTFAVTSPSTSQHLCEVISADKEYVDRAVNIAHTTFESGVWSRSDVRHRAEVLNKVAANLRLQIPRLAAMEVHQTGRAIREMNAQLARLPEWFEYFAALIRTHEGTCPPFLGAYVNYVNRVPLGVVTQLTAWNHPMLIAIKKIAPALAAGNSIVLKPSELAPVSVLELGPILTDSGVPPGVFNVLPGLGPLTGQVLCSHPLVRKVDLTGGTSTGRLVGAAAGSNLAGVITELGGKAPMLVFSDADIDQAVNGVAFATFVASGQTCIMGARVLVHEEVYDRFMAALVQKAKTIRLGDPFDNSTQMGTVISHASKDRIGEMVAASVQEGATILTGGDCPVLPSPNETGCYYSPTIIEVNPSMTIWREEVFGPVVVAVRFKDEAEAVALANDSPYGLAAAVWTKDVMRAHRVADRLDVGLVWVNDHHRNDPSSPWGGMKDSGVGRENGLSALHEYTQTKSVVVRMDDTPFDWFDQPNARYG